MFQIEIHCVVFFISVYSAICCSEKLAGECVRKVIIEIKFNRMNLSELRKSFEGLAFPFLVTSL